MTKRLDRVSPLAVPALLEISKEMVAGEAHEDILREAEESLIAEAMRICIRTERRKRSADGTSPSGFACYGGGDVTDDLFIDVNGETLLLDASGAAVVAGASARSSSPISISRRARPMRGAARCCRLTTRAPRSGA